MGPGPLREAREEVEGCSRQRATGDNTDQFDQKQGSRRGGELDSLRYLGRVLTSRLSLNLNL